MARCENKSRSCCAATDGNNGGWGGFRGSVDYAVGHKLVRGESACLVEEAVCDFASKRYSKRLDAHDSNLMMVRKWVQMLWNESGK